jgi:uncharacterized delta-60 repeat protein
MKKNTRHMRAIELLETRCYFSAGVLDPSFNGTGDATFSAAEQNLGVDLSSMTAEAIQPNGQILVAGSCTGGGFTEACIARFNPDGSIDTTFGTNGATIVSDSESDEPDVNINSLLVLNDGQIIAAGSANDVNPVSDEMDTMPAFYRLNSSGGSVASFLDDHYAYAQGSYIQSMALQSNGLVVAGGGVESLRSSTGMTMRINPLNFEVDTTFGNDQGHAVNDSFGVNAIAIDSSGRIVETGSDSNGLYISRLTTSGAVDSTFTEASSIETAGTIYPTGTAVAIQPDGKIVVAGFADVAGTSTDDPVVERVNSNGSADTSFNSTGYRGLVFGKNDYDDYISLALQSDGKILVGGAATNGEGTAASSAFSAIRLNANGSTDTTFGSSGEAKVPFGNSNNLQVSGNTFMVVDGDGRPVFAGDFGDASGTVWNTARLLPGEYAYSGTPLNLSASAATTIPAVNYDNGGEGVAYHDTDAANNSYFEGAPYFSALRPGSGVDLENNAAGSDPHVAYTEAGEYLQYTISVTTAGVYPVSASVADGGTGAAFHISVDGASGPEVVIPATGGFLDFRSIGVESVSLSVGTHVIRLSMDADDTDGFAGNFQSITFAAPTVTPNGTKLSGTAIGTSGSYSNDGNTIAKALDGNLATFFDGPTANGDTVGLDLGTPATIESIAYASRNGFASRMNGGTFQASNSATFASGDVTLYTIASNANPSSSVLTVQNLNISGTYRYVRYVAPAGSYGDVAEVQFYGKPGTVVTKLTGTTIGTAGSYGNSGNTIAKAVDGNLSTFFDGPVANGDWVGLDLGSSKTIGQISFAPRSGFASRMVGGEFQISTTANFTSGVTTIYTITTAPVTGSLTTITLSSPVTARYVRYLSPNGGYGDVAEISFYS